MSRINKKRQGVLGANFPPLGGRQVAQKRWVKASKIKEKRRHLCTHFFPKNALD